MGLHYQESLKFPNKFYWGTATAAFQIEGHPEEYLGKLSDWSEWIDRKDKVLDPSGDGRAVEHYQHMVEDVQLMRDMNTNSYRFSFNWARLHRGPGQFDENTLQFYSNLLDELMGKEPGKRIQPFATLVHFVIPNWLAKEGGWENPKTALEFSNFARFLAEKFSHRIKYWMTHNEPNIFLGFGYESGIWPPGKENDFFAYLRAYQGLLVGHQFAYKAIKEVNSEAQIGFAQNLYSYEPYDELMNPETISEPNWKKMDAVPNIIRKQLHNHAFIESCAELDALDFLGVNYYTRFSYALNPKAKDPANPELDATVWGDLKQLKSKTNALGWELYPRGLYKALTDKRLKSLIGDTPVFITENGYCQIETKEKDIEDPERIKFIHNHLVYLHKAITEGVNIRGYFYWSLLDNFEWALGMKPRFGLIHVDHETYQRSPKASSKFYAEIAKNNSLYLAN